MRDLNRHVSHLDMFMRDLHQDVIMKMLLFPEPGTLWKLFKSKTTYGNCAALHSTTRKVAVLSLHVAFKSTYNLPDISPKRNR